MWTATKRVVDATSLRVGGYLTAAGDAVEALVPARLRPAAHVARNLMPTHLMAYMAKKVRDDGRVLVPYFASSAVFSHVITPVLVATGVGATLALVARFVTTPLDVAVVFWRERRARRAEDPTLSNREVIADMARDYARFTETRRDVRRQLHKARAGRAPHALAAATR